MASKTTWHLLTKGEEQFVYNAKFKWWLILFYLLPLVGLFLMIWDMLALRLYRRAFFSVLFSAVMPAAASGAGRGSEVLVFLTFAIILMFYHTFTRSSAGLANLIEKGWSRSASSKHKRLNDALIEWRSKGIIVEKRLLKKIEHLPVGNVEKGSQKGPWDT